MCSVVMAHTPCCIQSIRNVPENTWSSQAKCLFCPEVQHANKAFLDVLSCRNVFQVGVFP